MHFLELRPIFLGTVTFIRKTLYFFQKKSHIQNTECGIFVYLLVYPENTLSQNSIRYSSLAFRGACGEPPRRFMAPAGCHCARCIPLESSDLSLIPTEVSILFIFHGANILLAWMSTLKNNLGRGVP